jgi:hypothetical protein
LRGGFGVAAAYIFAAITCFRVYFINKISACRKNLLQKMQIQSTVTLFLLITHTSKKAAIEVKHNLIITINAIEKPIGKGLRL